MRKKLEAPPIIIPESVARQVLRQAKSLEGMAIEAFTSNITSKTVLLLTLNKEELFSSSLPST